MRVYGVYQVKGYEYWNILVTSFGKNDFGEWFEGLAFHKNGNFVIKVSLKLPKEYEEIAYIYNSKDGKNFLKLFV